MGYDSVVFAFDDAAFSATVLPAFEKLRQTHLANPWMQQRLLIYLADSGAWDAELFPVEASEADVDLREWLMLIDDAADYAIPPNRIPIIAQNADPDYLFDAEAAPDCVMRVGALCLHDLWHAELVRACAIPAAYVGRNSYFDHWQDYAKREFGIPPKHRINELFEFLGMRGLAEGCEACTDIWGVQGWLWANETRELATLLDGYPLPRLADYAAAKQARNTFWASGVYDETAYQRLVLGILHCAATLATAKGFGLLHGVDMGPVI